MAFKGLTDYIERKREEFMAHVRKPTLDRLDQPEPVTYEEFQASFPMNSFEQHLLQDRIDDAGLARLVRDYRGNTNAFEPIGRYSLPKSYDDALARHLFPLMLDRFEKQLEEKKTMEAEIQALRDENLMLRVQPTLSGEKAANCSP